MKYTEHLVNSFLNSPHSGTISGADVVNRVINKETGDAVKIFMVIEDGKILDAKFQACGSVVLFASLSSIMDLIIGKTVEEALEVNEKQVIKEIKQVNRCDYAMVVFAVQALVSTLNNYFKKLSRQTTEPEKKQKKVKVRAFEPAQNITRCESVESSENTIESIFEESKPQEVKEPVVNEEVSQPESENVEVETSKFEVEPLIEEIEDEPVKPDLIESVPTKIEVRILDEEPIELLEVEEINEESEKFDTFELVQKPQPTSSKNKITKQSYLVKDENTSEKSEDVIDEIDSITAKLTDAISKLNFKFDVDDE